MNRAWPALPLIMIIVGTGLFGFGLWAWFTPSLLNVQLPAASLPVAEAPLSVLPQPDPVIRTKGNAITQVSALLSRSPYSPTRQAYSRTPVRPAPTEPEYQPSFIGIFGTGEATRAMVIWNPGDPEKTHAVGDQTPWGILVSATDEVLVFRDGDHERTLTLF